MSFEYHISESCGVFYCFAFDSLKRPAGRFKSVVFEEVIAWIAKRECITIFPSLDSKEPFFTSHYETWE